MAKSISDKITREQMQAMIEKTIMAYEGNLYDDLQSIIETLCTEYIKALPWRFVDNDGEPADTFDNFAFEDTAIGQRSFVVHPFA